MDTTLCDVLLFLLSVLLVLAQVLLLCCCSAALWRRDGQQQTTFLSFVSSPSSLAPSLVTCKQKMKWMTMAWWCWDTRSGVMSDVNVFVLCSSTFYA